MSVELVLDSNVELVSWVLAPPIVFHGFVDELLHVDHLIVCLLFVELIAFPHIHLVLVMLVAGHPDLGSDTEDQKRILLEVLEVEHGGRVRPVRVRVELRLQFLLLTDLVSVVLHLVDHWSCLHEVDGAQVNHNVVPFGNVSIELRWLRHWLIVEEKRPELLIFASLLDDDHLLGSLLVLLEVLDVLSCFGHVRGQVAIWHVASLPNVDRVVGAGIFVTSLDDENSSRVQFFALFAQVHVVHAKSASDFVWILRLVRTD